MQRLLTLDAFFRRIPSHIRRRGRGGGALPWNPSRLAPYLWLDPGAGITAPGDRVSTWVDKVGGVSLSEATNQLLYNATDAAYKNQPTVQCDAANRTISGSGISVPFPFSTFEYGEYSSGTYANVLSNSVTGYISALWQRSAGSFTLLATNAGGSANTPSIADTAAEKRSLYRGAAADGTYTLIRTKGTSAATTASGSNARAPTSSTANAVRIFYNASAAQGKLALYMIFRRELTADEVQRLHNWCVAKYG